MWKMMAVVGFAATLAVPSTATAQRSDSVAFRKALAKAELKVTRDRFNGRIVVEPAEYAKVPGAALVAGEIRHKVAGLWANLSYVSGDSTVSGYLLEFSAQLRSWSFLTGAVDLLVDGERITLQPRGRPSRSTHSEGVNETFSVAVDSAQVRKLAAASHVEFQLPAQRLKIEGTFGPVLRAHFVKMLGAPALAGTAALAPQ